MHVYVYIYFYAYVKFILTLFLRYVSNVIQITVDIQYYTFKKSILYVVRYGGLIWLETKIIEQK